MQANESPQLKKQIGILGATMMGLGSIVGTGVFVSIGIAAGIVGPAVILAVAIAAVVAICNGLSSAELAANHPVSGGTYEYGYKYLNSWLGFSAGWMFLLAKSASAATAALGFSGYLLSALGYPQTYLIPLALVAVVTFTVIVLSGISRTNWVNIAIVFVTLLTLLFFVVMGLPLISGVHLMPFFESVSGDGSPLSNLFHASALIFVAYTGYGRIATLGEEVHEPHRTIPRAIIFTLLITMILYFAVAVTGVGTVGAAVLSGTAHDAQAASLAMVARLFSVPFAPQILAIGAITAMLGVLLNLILGLSRVLLAMGRRRDMPSIFAELNQAQTTPVWSVLMMGVVIAGLVMIGNIKTTWSFSAFTVLIYYALTNLSALRLSAKERLFPPCVPALGLLFCLFLAFWVDRQTWMIGLALLGTGLAWHAIAQRYKSTFGG